MNTKTKNFETQNCVQLSVSLIMMVVVLLVTTNKTFAEVMINVYQLQEDGNYKTVNSDVKVTAEFLGDNGSEKLVLNTNKFGLFQFNGDNYKWLMLEIINNAGDIYKRKILPYYFEASGIDVQIYIGKTNFRYYKKGIAMPFYPVRNEVYLEFAQGKKEECEKELNEQGIFRIKNSIPTYSLKNEKLGRKKQLTWLLTKPEIQIVGPLLKETDNNVAKFFSKEVDVLFSSSSDEEEIKKLLKSQRLKKYQKISLYGDLSNYGNCKGYRVEFSNEQMIDYTFLKIIEDLLKHPIVLVVDTPILEFHKPD